jgi:N-methylhydantoinase A
LPHPVELVNLRLSACAPALLKSIDIRQEGQGSGTGGVVHVPELDRMVPIYSRSGLTPGVSLAGPLLITESASTAWIKPGWVFTTDEWGNLLLTGKADQ